MEKGCFDCLGIVQNIVAFFSGYQIKKECENCYETEKKWLEQWEQNRGKLESPVDLNTYFTQSEIAGRKLTVLRIGDCSIPTAPVLVRDPLVYLGFREEQPYFKSVPTGIFSNDDFDCNEGLCEGKIALDEWDGPYIGYEFGCTWDEEHGFGAMLHGNRVVKIGGADTAVLTWIAENDLER